VKLRCEYCGNYLSETDEVCPHCGAPNPNLARGAAGEPKTIEELRAFAEARHLPLEQMRFFLGEDCREPRAFGIYRADNGDFIVYKNKSDGSRAVRYQGKDEAFAVNELWQKMRSEIMARKGSRAAAPVSRSPSGRSRRGRRGPGFIIFIIIALAMLFTALRDFNSPSRGYYSYDGGYYYYDSDDWYYYDTADEDWYAADVDSDSPLYSDYDDYYQGGSYDSGSEYGDFRDSDWYSDSGGSWDSGSSWDDDWDSGSDWDTGSDWDSGSTDWDSDW
jgi:hypothetical protein